MPPRTLSREQVRRLDQRASAEYGVPGIVLMENAGRGAAERLVELGVAGPVVICCGSGNNGGDGFVIARHLDLRSIAVRVLVWGSPGQGTGDAAVNYRILERSGIPLISLPHDGDVAGAVARELAGAAWVVDALLGTGARGNPRPLLAAAITAINAAGIPVLAVDLPSGLDCDSGQPGEPTIRAAHTCTFVAPKPGFLAPGASTYTGAVTVVDIGAPRKLVEEMFADA